MDFYLQFQKDRSTYIVYNADAVAYEWLKKSPGGGLCLWICLTTIADVIDESLEYSADDLFVIIGLCSRSAAQYYVELMRIIFRGSDVDDRIYSLYFIFLTYCGIHERSKYRRVLVVVQVHLKVYTNS